MAKKGRFALALTRALRTLPKQPADAAIIALADQYARTLDAPAALVDVGGDGPMADLAAAATLSQLGAGYRAVLIELGLTPKARAAVMRGAEEKEPVKSPLDELRARRERTA